MPDVIGALRILFGTPVREGARRTRRRLLGGAERCEAVQAETLARVLGLSADSRWHQARGLSGSVSPRALASHLPPTTYDDYAEAIDQTLAGDRAALIGSRQQAVMFALSSGTTGRTKHIPVTKAFLSDYRRGWQAWGIGAFDAHRKLHTHNIFQIASSHNRTRSPGGIACGNISGLVQTMQSPVVRTMYSVPCATLAVTDPQAKAYAALKCGLADPRVAMAMAANPSSLVQLAEIARDRSADLVRDLHDGTFSGGETGQTSDLPIAVRRRLSRRSRRRARLLDRLAERDGHLRPSAYWPHLSLLACWTGGSCAAYLPRLRALYARADGSPIPIRDHGLSASEGRMTIPLDDETAGGLLDVTSHFFEFLPEHEIDNASAIPRLAHELEIGASYYILLTTSSGLVRYNIHDVVRCTGYLGTVPLLEFQHKGAHIASLTGEKLTESQVVGAVRVGCDASPFTVAPQWGEPPGYTLMLEAADDQAAAARAEIEPIETALRRANEEYDEKRASGRLRPLALRSLPPGTFARFARHRQAHIGGSAEQYKHPFLLPHLGAIDDLLLHASTLPLPPPSEAAATPETDSPGAVAV